MADWRYNRRPGFATATRAPRQRPSPPAPTSSPIAAAMTLTAFAVLWDYGLLLMLLYNMRPGTPAFTILSTVFNLLCSAFDFVCYNFMEIIEFFLSIPIAVVVGYLNIDPAAIKYDVLYVRNACSRAVRGYLVAQRERARRRAVAAWHRGCGYVDYQRKLHCWYAVNICAMIVGSIQGRIRDIMDDCTTFIYLTPPLAETYMTVWQAWLWLLWMRDGASLLMSYLPAFHKPSSNSTSATEQSTPNASRSTTPVSDNEAPASNSSQPTSPEPQPSLEKTSPRTNPVAESERAERRERRERKKREERAARKREAELRAARSKEERERRQLQERLAREAEERRLEQEEQDRRLVQEEQDRRLVQEEQERQRKAQEQAAQEEERQRQAQEQAALEKERQRKAQEQAELEKERQRKAYEQAALEKARSQSTAGQLLKQAIAKAATEQKTKPQPTVPLAPAGAASVQLPKTLPPVVLQKTTGPSLPFSLSAVPSMTTNPPRTSSTASTQPPSQPVPQPQAPVLQQRPAMNLQPRLGQGQNVPQQPRPQPQQSALGTPAGSLASPSGPHAFPTVFPNGTARQRAAAGLPFPISTPPSAPAAPITLAPPASALPLQPQPQQHRSPGEMRLAVLARIAALKQEAQQVQPQSQSPQQPQQPKPKLPIFNSQPTPISSVAGPSAASVQPTLFPANALQITSSSNRTGTFSGGFNGAVVGPSMPAFPSTTIPIHPVNIPQTQAVAEPMEIDTPTPFIHNPSPLPESDLMDIDDIEMEDAWPADCSATLSSDILPLSAPPTMEVDDGWPESCPSPEWFPLATPQPSRPVTPAPLSPPPTVVRSPEIVMEVVAVPQNAPTPLPTATSPATPPKAAPREVTAPTTFSVPLQPTGTAVSASSVTPKPAQGPSSSTPPKATLNASKQSATPGKPTDPPKAPAPAPSAAKASPSSISPSSSPAKPKSVVPPASQAMSGKSSPSATSSTSPRAPDQAGPSATASFKTPASSLKAVAPAPPEKVVPSAASRVSGGSAKPKARLSTQKLRMLGLLPKEEPEEKSQDKKIEAKFEGVHPTDVDRPSAASSNIAANVRPNRAQPRPRTSILRPASLTSTPTSADMKMSNAPSATSSPSPARPAPVVAASATITAATSSPSSDSPSLTGPVNTAQSLTSSSSSSSSTGTDSVMGDSSSSSAAPAPSAPTSMPSTQADNNGAPARRPIRDLPKTFGPRTRGKYKVATPIVDPGETEFQNADQEIAKAADAASNSSQANPNLARADAMFDDDDDDNDKKNDEFVDFEQLVSAVDPDALVFASPGMELWPGATFLSLPKTMSWEPPAPAVSQQGLAASSTSTPTSTQPTYASSSSPSSAPSDLSSFPPGRPNPAIRLVPLKHNHPTTSVPSSAPPGEADDTNTRCLRQVWAYKGERLRNLLIYGDENGLSSW